MRIGVPKEVKSEEYRVGLTPSSVRELVEQGHEVMIQHNAGVAIDFTDDDYRKNGAAVLSDAAQVYQQAEMIIKVKEPQPSEYGLLRAGQIVFTYLHLAPNPVLTQALIDSNCVAIAYETVTDVAGSLPLLKPMSQVAGRLSIEAGAHALQQSQGGRGILLSGVPGVDPGKVVVIGGGVVGSNAIRMALGKEAMVTVLDKSAARLQVLDAQFGGRLNTIHATTSTIEQYVSDADLVIGAVLVPGAATPELVSREMIKGMRPGAVVVDVAIDQGGCFATSRPTTHADPIFIIDQVVHYCVANMPAAVPRTATLALNNVTLPFIVAIASKGYQQAMRDDVHLRNGLNVHKGQVTQSEVAFHLALEYTSADTILE